MIPILRRSIPILLAVALICIGSGRANAQLGGLRIPDIGKIEKSIAAQADSIEAAKRAAEKLKQEENERLELERKLLEEKRKLEAETAMKRQEEESQRLKQLDDLRKLRETIETLVHDISTLQADLVKSNDALSIANARLEAKEGELKRDRELFEMEKSKLALESDLQSAKAEGSSIRWFLGFCVSAITLCVTVSAAVIDHRHKNAEIAKIKRELGESEVTRSIESHDAAAKTDLAAKTA